MSINNTNHVNTTNNKLLTTDSIPHTEESFDSITWNDVIYDGGLATWTPRSSFRWLTISICLIGIIGNVLAVCTLLRRRMRTLSTYVYLTALCLSNSVTLLFVIVFELEVLFEPNGFYCILVSLSKAIAASTFALSTW